MTEQDDLVPLDAQPMRPKIFSLSQSYVTYITCCARLILKEKKPAVTENTTGMCHLKISLCPHKQECPAAGTETEDCSGHGRKVAFKRPYAKG